LLFGSGDPEYEGIPVNKTPIFEPILVIKDPLPPDLGTGSIIDPDPVDLGIGVIADPLPPDLGTNITKTPIGQGGGLIVNATSNKTWGQRAAEAFLILLLLQHNIQQDVQGNTLTSSSPPPYSVTVEDPTPEELKQLLDANNQTGGPDPNNPNPGQP
jgi:hypothetical protein